jgi:hypothetical protein
VETVHTDILTQVLAFTHSLAHYAGHAIVAGIQYILPMAKGLTALVDPIGYLTILTVFVILTALVRKVAIVILMVGWVLIIIRIALMTFGV